MDFIRLPKLVINIIFAELNVKDIMHLGSTCKKYLPFHVEYYEYLLMNRANVYKYTNIHMNRHLFKINKYNLVDCMQFCDIFYSLNMLNIDNILYIIDRIRCSLSENLSDNIYQLINHINHNFPENSKQILLDKFHSKIIEVYRDLYNLKLCNWLIDYKDVDGDVRLYISSHYGITKDADKIIYYMYGFDINNIEFEFEDNARYVESLSPELYDAVYKNEIRIKHLIFLMTNKHRIKYNIPLILHIIKSIYLDKNISIWEFEKSEHNIPKLIKDIATIHIFDYEQAAFTIVGYFLNMLKDIYGKQKYVDMFYVIIANKYPLMIDIYKYIMDFKMDL